jgi:NADH-quinone oxidoreductase subunit K
MLAATVVASIGLTHYLTLAAALFCLGVLTMISKRNAIGILIGVELVLNSANLNLVAFNRYQAGGDAARVLMDGQVFALFVIVLAAAEAAVAIAIFMNFYNSIGSVDVDQASRLRG